jgi:hypothetical protein
LLGGNAGCFIEPKRLGGQIIITNFESRSARWILQKKRKEKLVKQLVRKRRIDEITGPKRLLSSLKKESSPASFLGYEKPLVK